MLKNAILSLSEPFTRWEQFLFTNQLSKKLQTRVFKTKVIENTQFEIVNIPYCTDKKQSIRQQEKFAKILVDMLKDRGIGTVWLQNNVPFPNILKEKLEESFEQIYGENILQYACFPIIKKYIRVNNSTTHDSELIFLCDNVDKTQPVIEKICKHVKSLSIVTNQIAEFVPFCEYIFQEYGLYVGLSENMNDFVGKKKIYINLAKDTDFFLKKAQTNHLPILNLSGKEIIKENCINYATFDLKPAFSELYCYCFKKDQAFIEYIITVLNNNCNEKLIQEFFKKYFVTLRKIYAKNC